MKQIILVKTLIKKEYEEIKAAIEQGLSSDAERFCVPGSPEVGIEVIEIPDTDEKPMTVHNTHMGMSLDDFKTMLLAFKSMAG